MTSQPFIRKTGRAGRISLNHPSSKNALTRCICDSLLNTISVWENDASIEVIIIDHAESVPGFSKGVDVKFLSSEHARATGESQHFLRSLYQLCHFISQCRTPIVTCLNGLVRGSAIGLALSGTYQIATERTDMSFPETGYGFIPDCGASLFLSRLPGELGKWLALTGSAIKGTDVVALGLASHFCESDALGSLIGELQHEGIVALKPYTSSAPITFRDRLEEINDVFALGDAHQILRHLNRGSSWAKSQATRMAAKSPLSTRIVFRQIDTGAYLGSLKEAVMIEYRIASRLCYTRNFAEGVRAMFLDMDHNPYWKPRALRKVTYDMVSQFYSPLKPAELTFSTYAHQASEIAA